MKPAPILDMERGQELGIMLVPMLVLVLVAHKLFGLGPVATELEVAIDVLVKRIVVAKQRQQFELKRFPMRMKCNETFAIWLVCYFHQSN